MGEKKTKKDKRKRRKQDAAAMLDGDHSSTRQAASELDDIRRSLERLEGDVQYLRQTLSLLAAEKPNQPARDSLYNAASHGR